MSEKHARKAVYERSSGCCEVCGNCPGQSFHHRKSRSQGGLWSAANGLHLCGDGTTGCHGWITEHPAASYADGWLVPGAYEPRTVPTNYRGRWAFLDDEGGVTYMDGGTRHDVGW